LKPTHQLRNGTHDDVTAWQFLKDSPRPVWVFRAFHDLGGGHHLTHRSGVKVKPTDWIVRTSEASCIVLTDEEFNNCFVALPDNG
jgi:hypothetical protein